MRPKYARGRSLPTRDRVDDRSPLDDDGETGQPEADPDEPHVVRDAEVPEPGGGVLVLERVRRMSEVEVRERVDPEADLRTG